MKTATTRTVVSLVLASTPTPAYGGQAIDVGDLGFRRGSPDAPVQVVEFSDFSCPHCRSFHEETYPLIHEAYVASGKVLWIYVTFSSGQYANSFAAGLTAECAGAQGHFDVVMERLYRQQDEWKAKPPGEAGALFRKSVDDLALDDEAFIACLANRNTADRIDRGAALAAELGVRGTPTYVIDGFPAVGAMPAEVLSRILDARLDQLGFVRRDSPPPPL